YEALENIGYDETLKTRLTQLQDQLDEISAQLVQVSNPTATVTEIEKYLNKFLDGDYIDLRYKILKELVFKVVVFPDYFDVYFGTSDTSPQNDDCSHSGANGSPKPKGKLWVFCLQRDCMILSYPRFARRTPFRADASLNK
ncbi:MAG: hypothetical protein K2G31_03435, partial [Clostridia bacterium]|nr:hypothetical protein [Clostridia bacterium]